MEMESQIRIAIPNWRLLYNGKSVPNVTNVLTFPLGSYLAPLLISPKLRSSQSPVQKSGCSDCWNGRTQKQLVEDWSQGMVAHLKNKPHSCGGKE